PGRGALAHGQRCRRPDRVRAGQARGTLSAVIGRTTVLVLVLGCSSPGPAPPPSTVASQARGEQPAPGSGGGPTFGTEAAPPGGAAAALPDAGRPRGAECRSDADCELSRLDPSSCCPTCDLRALTHAAATAEAARCQDRNAR